MMVKYRVEFKCQSDNFGNYHLDFESYDKAFAYVLGHMEMMNDYDEVVLCFWRILRWSESLERWERLNQITMYRYV